MCDCYSHKCEKCDVRLPIHITDFCVERDEIRVYCDAHIPENNVVVFTSLGGRTVPIDTRRNRVLLEGINALRERLRTLWRQQEELDEADEAYHDEINRCVKREWELVQKLEQRLLTPEESHMLLPGFFGGDIWEYVVDSLKDFPKGFRIGVQFLCDLPHGYPLDDIVTPNVSVEYETRVLGNPVVGKER